MMVTESLRMSRKVPEMVVEVRCGVLAASPETVRLLQNGGTARVYEMWADDRDRIADGTYYLPAGFSEAYAPALDVDEILEVQQALFAFGDVGYSPVCAHPPCILASEQMWQGFSVCAHHGQMLAHLS